jgi:hypothetical protein
MMTPATKQCIICNEQFADDRDLRYHNRTCKIAPLQKEKPGGAVRKIDASKGNKDCETANTENKTTKDAFVRSTVPNPRIDKSQGASVPIQNHSPNIGESKDGRNPFPKSDDCHASTPNQHPNRDSNALPSLEREKKIKLQLPKSNESAKWSEIDKELKDALPQVFGKSTIKTSSPQKLTQKFDNWLYKFFDDRFGTVPPPTEKKTFVKRPHKGLARLRATKNRIRKALRALTRCGLKDSPEWKKLSAEGRAVMRKHNKLRIAIKRKATQKEAAKASKAFKSDPFKYTKNLFSPPSAAGDPNFSKESAEAYFVPLYRDEERDYLYQHLPNMKRPELPQNPFDIKVPTLAELHRSVRAKKNGAAPGMNGLPYIIYKKCPSIIYYLHLIIKKVWESGDIPHDWAMAYISLIAKSSNLDLPSEFRPIAVGDTAGKIFFSIIADRLQHYMVSNNYIKRAVQKGFLSGVAGCVEHPFALYEGLRDAFENTRSICTTWIDLANAFGSVRHNLIQFALDWYHVPKFIQGLIMTYYDLLCAKIVTKDWATMFFHFDIGCFQGCVLSAILFDCVFNLLLDYLLPLEKLGYLIKATTIKISAKAYADDLNLTTDTSKNNQKVLNRTDEWLEWTKTMKAKPTKCISLAYRQFKPETNQLGFVPLSNTIYAPYDPLLTIAGQPIRFIWDQKGESFKDKHFKFLGRWISMHINEQDVQRYIKAEFLRFMQLVDKDLTPGPMKLWMYQFGILGRLTWPFMSQDYLPLSLALNLDRHTNRYLKSWAGLFKSADLGVLYRSRDRFGLGITKTSVHFKKTSVVKCLLLKQSKDPVIGQLYDKRATRETKLSVWRASKETSKVEQIADHKLHFAGQTHRQGLGNGCYDNQPSNATYRKLCSQAVADCEAEQHWSHAHSLNMQGIWTVWSEITHPLDFSWNTLIYGPGKCIISFLLNATINTLPSKYLLRLLGYKTNSRCPLCKNNNCNVSHVLGGCRFSLTSKRYTWRHDSVLLTIYSAVEPHIKEHNTKKVLPTTILPSISFVPSGTSSAPTKKKKPIHRHLLSEANDWQILVDLEHKLVFPPEIFSTNQRPDIVIWSINAKKVLLVELTVPCDENIEAAQTRKTGRYTQLSSDINSTTDWNSTIITIEVGARGFVARTMSSFFRRIGFTTQSASALCKSISLVTARCSHHIWLHRDNKKWKSGALLTPIVPVDNTDVQHK